MITELLLSGLFAIAEWMLSLLPDITWSVDTSAWEYVRDIVSMIAYLLPMGHITAVISLIIAIAFLRIAISFIRTVIGLIPFV